MKSTPPKKNRGEKLLKSANLFPVVGVGASAGGLDAFKKLLRAIPEDSGMAFVLVQHLDPNHESMLPEILQKITPIPVMEISDEIKVQPNHIYIIPSNKMLVATDGILQLEPRPAKSRTERNLPIDLFFGSLAEVHQAHAIGVVLSGTASDGTLGLKAIKGHGGITFAQDEESAAYEGMPHSAIEAGVVDFILPPEKIPQKLIEVTRILNTSAVREDKESVELEDLFRQVLSVLRIRKGTDFTYYKQTTIRRRITRRMALNQNKAMGEYLKFLREHKEEQDALYNDLLIPVTSFFRDKKSFENLVEIVFPLILKNKTSYDPLRVWVAGCSTGEEAYSIAISLKEYFNEANSGSGEKVQIFASDLSELAITKARLGIYSKIELVGVSPRRLTDFFSMTNGHYQVNKQVRDMCVFAHHNFLKDPPFGKVDLISCRNVLIYMEPYLQKKALTTFHYALNPSGYLMLGKSETISGVPELFAPASIIEKIFSRKDVPGRFMTAASPRSEQNLLHHNPPTRNEFIRSDFQKTADDIILSKYTPPGVVVNEMMDIVHFRGSTVNYLEQTTGKPSHNLLAMAKHGLAFELRNILHKAKKEKAPVLKEGIPVEVNGVLRYISIEALPLANTRDLHFLILFHDQDSTRHQPFLAQETPPIVPLSHTQKDRHARIRQLEKELAQTREDMRSITEDMEASNEELQSANEELLSGSEELQSLNEELETSKEELQSTVEELMVVNQEMLSLNEQIAVARNYAESIVANIREPLLVLDNNLRIKTANNAFYKTFRVNKSETEGALIYELGNKQWDIPELRTLLEKILPEKSIFNDFEVTHTFPTIGSLIMLLNAREVIHKNSSEKLILLSIEDITERKEAERRVKISEYRYHNMINSSPSMICIFKGKEMIIEIANEAILKSWDKGHDCIGKSLFTVLPEIKAQGFDKLLMNVFKTGKPFHAYESPVTLIRKGKAELIYYNFTYQAQRNSKEEIEGVAIIANEVTPQAILNKKIKESEENFRQLAELMPQKISHADESGRVFYYNKNWLEYTGLDAEDLITHGWIKFIHPEEQQEVNKRWNRSIKSGKNFEIEMRIQNKAGEYKWHLSRAAPVKDDKGKIVKWIGATTEIQQQVELREALEKAVDKRTRDLKTANAELIKVNKELEAFAYVSSHDLQEPLRKIQTFAGRLLEKENKNLSDKGQHYFRILQDSAQRMQTLIEDLLSFSRLNTSKRKFETTDLGPFIETIKSDFKEVIDQKQAVIEVIELCPLNVVPFQFRQLLQNLIGNALKFSHPKRPPHITIRCRTEKGRKTRNHLLSPDKNYVHLSVADNGLGFENEYNDKIFEVFQKLHTKEEYAGTGIGLAIVKKIVENHNGIITTRSKINKGATFDIYIPAH